MANLSNESDSSQLTPKEPIRVVNLLQAYAVFEKIISLDHTTITSPEQLVELGNVPAAMGAIVNHIASRTGVTDANSRYAEWIDQQGKQMRMWVGYPGSVPLPKTPEELEEFYAKNPTPGFVKLRIHQDGYEYNGYDEVYMTSLDYVMPKPHFPNEEIMIQHYLLWGPLFDSAYLRQGQLKATIGERRKNMPTKEATQLFVQDMQEVAVALLDRSHEILLRSVLNANTQLPPGE